MFDFSKPFGNAALALLVSAALHIAVVLVSLGGYLVPMLSGAVLWTICAFLLPQAGRWFAGLVFFLALFAAATIPLAGALSEFGLVSIAFWGIVFADLAAAIMLFLTLWRPAPERADL